MAESYLTAARLGEAEYTDKKSRFIGHVQSVANEEEAKAFIASVRARYADATHNVWAYTLRSGTVRWSDDGEPGGTSGQPTLAVLKGAGLENVCCVTTRYFGGILLGNVMGRGDMDKAKEYASHMMRLTVLAGAFGGVIVLACIPGILRFASLSDVAMGYLKKMLLINSYYVMGGAVNTSLIAGVFRAGGDTRFGMICDTIDMWGYAVPLGFFAAFVLKLPVMWVYFLLCTDEFVKWPWVFRRYFSGKWLQNITRDNLFEQ